jgi:glycerol-3-phosphate cytidylyltransferase
MSNSNKIGFTCSTFDLFHAGHVAMLEECKQNCDYLIVGLQTDPSIDREEKNKPVQSIVERYVQLSACKYVDEIVPYETEKDLLDYLKLHERTINIRFVGEEYMDKDFTGRELTSTFGDDNKMIIYYNRRSHDFSSSELRKRIQNA